MIITVSIELSSGSATSDVVKQASGDIAGIITRHESVGSAVVWAIDQMLDEDGTDYEELWRSPSSNTDGAITPSVIATDEDGGVDGRAPLAVDNKYGWRIRRVSGASSGTITLYVNMRV